MISQKCYMSMKKHLDKLQKRGRMKSNLKSYGGEMVINTNKLRGIIAEKGKTQTDVAHAIGITPKTFYEKMKNGVFGSDEIEVMIELLDIEDPAAIFFSPRVTLKDTAAK